MGLLDQLQSFGQGASNSAASTVTAPVDGLAWLLRKMGVPVPSDPVGGSDWAAKQGLTATPKNHIAGLLGEAFGGVAPMVAAAKAPQIAKSLLQMGENAAIPQTLNKQAGMALFDTSGLPDKGRNLIQSKAEELSNRLREAGFKADIQHSGSMAGPSSYIKVFDPLTGRYFDDLRLSGHSKGVFNSQSVRNVATPEEFDLVIKGALDMRGLGPSSGMKSQTDIEKLAQEYIAAGSKPRSAYNKARLKLGL